MKILVLGNGFNLDMGLETRYIDFVKSQEWKDLYNKFHRTSNKNLAGFLKKRAGESHWFALEECLAEYAKKKIKKQDFSHVNDDKWFLELLEEQLQDYLTMVSQDPQNESHLSTRLISIMNNKSIFDKIYTFNYITHEALHNWHGCNYEDAVFHVHQKLYCGIVLGVAENDITDDRYSFLRKVNHKAYESTGFGNNLMKADEVVFWGHSLHAIDFDYFRDFFMAHSRYDESRTKPVHITIIDKNDDSIQSIKDRLRNNGISLISLYQYSHLTFVSLDNFYSGDSIEYDKIKNLLKRLNIGDYNKFLSAQT